MMGGGTIAFYDLGSGIDNYLLNQTAASIQNQMANAVMSNRQAQANMNQPFGSGVQNPHGGSFRPYTPNPAPKPSVPSTAASRVQKADWEMEYDRKEREVDEMIERQRQERERVRIDEESGNDPRGED